MRVARCPLQQFSLCCAVISVEADDQSVDSPYTGSSERASVGRQGGRRLSYRERCPCFVRAVECPIAWDRINRRCGLEQRDALWAWLWVSDAEKNERDSSAHERFFFFLLLMTPYCTKEIILARPATWLLAGWGPRCRGGHFFGACC